MLSWTRRKQQAGMHAGRQHTVCVVGCVPCAGCGGSQHNPMRMLLCELLRESGAGGEGTLLGLVLEAG